jgi:N-acyl-D-amino-acid deacylase
MEAMNDDDVRRFLGWEHTVVGSDGIPLPGKPHPRLTGTFPRVLSRYRDVYGSLEEAVHRMTGATASRFKIPHRGVIGDGRVADLVVIDPGRVRDTGTYDNPWQPPAGIEYVMLAGNAVVWHGETIDSSRGAVLSVPEPRPAARIDREAGSTGRESSVGGIPLGVHEGPTHGRQLAVPRIRSRRRPSSTTSCQRERWAPP